MSFVTRRGNTKKHEEHFGIAKYGLFDLQNVHEQTDKRGSMLVVITLPFLTGDFVPDHVSHQPSKPGCNRGTLLVRYSDHTLEVFAFP